MPVVEVVFFQQYLEEQKKDGRRSQSPLHGYLARRQENESQILHMDSVKTSAVSLPGHSALKGNVGVHHHILVARVPHCKATVMPVPGEAHPA